MKSITKGMKYTVPPNHMQVEKTELQAPNIVASGKDWFLLLFYITVY